MRNGRIYLSYDGKFHVQALMETVLLEKPHQILHYSSSKYQILQLLQTGWFLRGKSLSYILVLPITESFVTGGS